MRWAGETGRPGLKRGSEINQRSKSSVCWLASVRSSQKVKSKVIEKTNCQALIRKAHTRIRSKTRTASKPTRWQLKGSSVLNPAYQPPKPQSRRTSSKQTSNEQVSVRRRKRGLSTQLDSSLWVETSLLRKERWWRARSCCPSLKTSLERLEARSTSTVSSRPETQRASGAPWTCPSRPTSLRAARDSRLPRRRRQCPKLSLINTLQPKT